MKRRLFNLMALLSLALCFTIALLWVRSYWRWDHFIWKWEDGTGAVAIERQRQIYSMHGSVGIQRVSQEMVYASEERAREVRQMLATQREFNWKKGKPAAPITPSNLWERIGFWSGLNTVKLPNVDARSAQRQSRMLTITWFSVPHWFLGIPCSVPLLLWVRSYARAVASRRRLRQSLCPACGYDLRATPDRCPECGAVPERSAMKSTA
jgi:hypothetical protein